MKKEHHFYIFFFLYIIGSVILYSFLPSIINFKDWIISLIGIVLIAFAGYNLGVALK